jgi:hypothetical protein
METMSITDVLRRPLDFRKALEKGKVKITWREQKPGGKIIFSAKAEREV